MEPQSWLIGVNSTSGEDLRSATSRSSEPLMEGGNDRSPSNTSHIQSSPLRLALPSDDARGQYLSATRRETHDALALFHAHVKSSVSLMFGIMTAVLAVVGVALQRNPSPKLLGVVLHGAPLILLLIFPFSVVAVLVTGRYYRFYVAALVYAANLHEQEGVGMHQWFGEVKALKSTLGDTVDEGRLVRARMYSWPNSWLLYALLIEFIGLTSVVLAILLWFQS